MLFSRWLLTRLEVEAVLFDVFADPLALHLAAETTESLFEGLVVSDGDGDQGWLRTGWRSLDENGLPYEGGGVPPNSMSPNNAPAR